MMPKAAATEVVRTLRAKGHAAWLVGGCVRDLVLGREPADYDVTTSATPEQVMTIFPKTFAVGAQFGVMLVAFDSAPANDQGPTANDGSFNIEVATFRSDVGYSDGRHPDAVVYARSAEEDVQRRDFTINGLLMDPLSGEVVDYVGGRAAIENKVIRTIGDPLLRFTEDKLRMLRAVRFAARFGYRVDDATLAAIRKLAPQVHQVSHERIRDELVKMLTEGAARRAFELLDETGLLHELLPEVERMKGVEQPPQFHPEGDVWVHTLLVLEKLQAAVPPALALGALLHDVGKPPTFRVAPDRIRFDGHVEVGERMAQEICSRLRLSHAETEHVCALVANHMRFADAPRMKASTLKRFFRLPKFEEHLELHRMDCLSSHADLSLYDFVKQKLAATPPEQIRPQPLVTGHDLIALGYQPGPEFKSILQAAEDAQLEAHFSTKEAALEFVRRAFPAPSAVQPRKNQ
ncbi:MAG: CCA tRNA nucleotidyltransferase [Candidatus Koribacter versatilis]|uniref:CCA tRNA nucleotidyltransferase n=1 Tax=Candidatus Korobacter versatilis TaxID=658062 RepID=A0A932EQ63_9BACT|nr:CCA tRNA nucleotidyltransferase [Candidatus Koribacter versatilis]